ncbi:MAG: polysaccharide pyruvyl transferase family protein [Vicinamibacteria bacterium]|nr:polysaccharide pyruvyl transferase family protein [Vicinamibacteria bacterium]
MKLRVLHAATHGHNIGDGALVAGIHATLAADLGRELAITEIDVLGHKLRRERDMLPAARYAQLEPELDLVLVGGGGLIEGGPGNYLSGLNFGFDLGLLERARVPWVFYALGANQFRHTRFFHRDRLRRLLSLVEAKGLLFSVRNDGSRERLQRLVGRELPFVHSIPDPGLWVPTRQQALPEFAPDRPNLLVQLAGDRPWQRLGGWRGRLRRLAGLDPLAALARTLAALARERGVRLVLCPHLVTDLELVARFVSLLPMQVARDAVTLSPVLKGAAGAPDFFERYRRADLVVGMRGHSAICAVGLGTPFVGLATHDKIGGFLADVGLADWSVDLETDPGFDGLRPLLEHLLDDLPAARSRVRSALPALRQRTRDFHAAIAARL